jgi:hypothetical protein
MWNESNRGLEPVEDRPFSPIYVHAANGSAMRFAVVIPGVHTAYDCYWRILK